jgi:hypothetical protein
LFLAQFADACNAVWDDEQKVVEGALAMKDRRCFNMLLIGQGGSGKTALIQEVVLPAMDFLFPPEDDKAYASTLIVCAKWSQAENISTATHKAISCHRAGLVGIQKFRNGLMLPGDKRPALVRRWDPVRCFVIEETSMISPGMYNMLLYRSFHGRSQRWEVGEAEYDKLKGAFGRMPIVIHLGDFLQLKPTGCGLSLIATLKDMEASGEDIPAEYQSAMKLFCRTPLCFELQASNRFKEPRLRELMNFMRDPSKRIPPSVAASWESIQLTDSDERLRAERFQNGHMIAIYWETVARWMMMRTKRDARALKTPLYLLQAADASSPPMPMEVAKKMMNKANPKYTGAMHGMLPVHLGMRIRLLEALDLANGLVKDAEGEVVHIVSNPLDQDEVDAAMSSGADTIYLRHLPLGVWVRMGKYTGAPFCKTLLDQDDSLLPSHTQSLVFIEPRTSKAFIFREHKVIRTGFPFSHGQVITSTACQGRTMRAGVIIDCGRIEVGDTKKHDEDWWLDLYVMLSRATRLEDLLLMRAPPSSFLLQGPPKSLRQQLVQFARRSEACRETAATLAAELGFSEFFH